MCALKLPELYLEYKANSSEAGEPRNFFFSIAFLIVFLIVFLKPFPEVQTKLLAKV